MLSRFENIKLLNSLIIEIEKAKIFHEIVALLEDIYNILRYLINSYVSRRRFARILFILILFYKTYFSRLNLTTLFIFLNTPIFFDYNS